MGLKRDKERNVGGRRINTRSMKPRHKKPVILIETSQEALDMEKYIQYNILQA